MKTKILPYAELKDLPGYKDLCETSYNTLVKSVDKIIPKVKKLKLTCNMTYYGGYQNYSEIDVTQQNACGTSACIMGVIATLFPLNPEHFMDFNLGFSYERFQKDMIPGLNGLRRDSIANMWDYLFAEQWSNSFEAGVERIKTVLSGQYDENWDYDFN